MPAGGIIATALTAVVLFVATNVDDILVLTVLNISSRAVGRPRRWHIWAGQYAGTAILVAVSLAAAAGLALVPLRWLWLLGLLPLGIGLARLATAIRTRRSGQHASPAAVTFLAGIGVYCLASTHFAGHRKVIQAIHHWGQWVVPVVLILIGCYIFVKTGAL